MTSSTVTGRNMSSMIIKKIIAAVGSIVEVDEYDEYV